jgi:hypothetical protein
MEGWSVCSWRYVADRRGDEEGVLLNDVGKKREWTRARRGNGTVDSREKANQNIIGNQRQC